MLWITRWRWRRATTATSFIAEFVESIRGGGHGETIAITFNKITGKLDDQDGAYDVVQGFVLRGSGFEGVEYTIATDSGAPVYVEYAGR
jgi:hypothetical protein